MKLKGYNVNLSVEKYYDGNLAVLLYTEDGELFSDLTVNIAPLPKGFAAVDTNNNGQEILKFIEKYKLGKVTDYLQSGYCTYPVVEFDMKMLKKLDIKNK